MRFTTRHASNLAAFALVLVLAGIGAFVVRSMMSARDAASDAHKATEITIAFEDARYRVLVVQRTAELHLDGPTPESRANFDRAVDEALASMGHIREVGEAEDIAAVDIIYERDLPALETIKRIFLSLERGEPITDEIPPADTADRILAVLEPRAAAREEFASAQLEGLVADQSRDLRITLAVCLAGLLLVLGLVVAVQRFGRREAVQQAELGRLRTAALTDSLTGLGNHRAFVEELRRQVARSTRHGEALALAVIDVDEFKQVNDTWGHARGDEVLVEVATMLNGFTRAEDYAFRIGGDEFAIILTHADGQAAMTAMEHLRVTMGRAVKDGPTLSIGIASVTDCDGDDTVLRQQADSALYDAKLKGRDAAILYTAMEGARPVFPAAKLASLRQVIADRAVLAVFQPIWNLSDGRLLAHEALARIPDEYGIPSPQLAFDMAERLGKSAELDRACRAAILRSAPAIPDGSLLFVNISPYALTHASFSASGVAAEFAAAGLLPSRVVLEVSERSAVSIPVVERAVRDLRSVGFKIALDDVGSGNAGLEMLRRVPVEFVKMDRAVLLSALADPMGRAAVMAIAAFAAQAGALVVAEGIEDERMMELVRWIAAGGDEPADPLVYAVQGFLLGVPSSDVSTGEPPGQLAA